jgi:8-oxo-dGTP pyrophosphatase MutT (NUDIX family)
MIGFTALCDQLANRLRDARAQVEQDSVVPQAAVAVILRQKHGDSELLVIRRAQSGRDHWSGHLALPGGRKHPDDANLLSTAMRETLEEVGLDLAHGGRVLGALERVAPRSAGAPRIGVTPFVFAAPARFHVLSDTPVHDALTLNAEVAVAFWCPLAAFVDHGRSTSFRGKVAGEERDWPAYATPEGPIWGLTERVITQLLALLPAH